jgi:RNA polymerase sigma-70 factor, ECF subfamily
VLYAHVRRRVRACGVPHADVDDAAQDVFLALERRRAELAQHPELRGWLDVTARWVSQNRARARRRESKRRCDLGDALDRAVAERSEEPDRLLSRRQTCSAFQRALRSLRAEQREAIWLAALEGYSAAEIAADVDAPVATIASRLRLGRLRLRRLLGGL